MPFGHDAAHSFGRAKNQNPPPLSQVDPGASITFAGVGGTEGNGVDAGVFTNDTGPPEVTDGLGAIVTVTMTVVEQIFVFGSHWARAPASLVH